MERHTVIFRNWLAALGLALLCAVAWAEPSVQDVQAQVREGHYAQAESMMREVIEAKPNSAKGHYVYAELLAHNGNFTLASSEAAKARSLDPSLKYGDPDKIRAFEQLLQRETTQARSSGNTSAGGASLGNLGDTSRVGAPRATDSGRAVAPAAPAEAPRSGLPGWIWGVGLIAVAWFLWRGFARSRASAPAAGVPPAGYGAQPSPFPGQQPPAGYGPAPGMPYGQPNAQPPYGQPYGAQPNPGGGLLRTGMAVAGGVAAGALASELFHRNQQGQVPGNDSLSGLQSASMFDPPARDDAAADLERRDVDFGNGNDWGGDAPDLGGGGGGSDDGGGGGWD